MSRSPETPAHAPQSETSQGFYETGLTLANFSVLVDAWNPYSTNQKRARRHMEQLEMLGHHFEIISVETSANPLETALAIEEAMGDRASKSVIFAGTGDGGNGGLVRAAIGRGAALWQSNAGFANNLSRSLYPMRDRYNPERIYEHGRIVRSKAAECEITGPDGELIFKDLFVDEFGIGNMAHAQVAREDKEHRAALKEASDAEGLRKIIKLARVLAKTAIISSAAIDAAPGYEVKFGVADPNSPEDNRPTERLNELIFSNIGHIAWIGRIRGINPTDQKLSMVTDSYKTKLGPRVFYARLYTYGAKGKDIPDGHTVEFDLVTGSNAQKSGDPFPLPAGSQVKIKRTDKDLLLVTTR